MILLFALWRQVKFTDCALYPRHLCLGLYGARVLYRPMLYNICMSKFKSHKNVVYWCKYHVVFCPKYRRKVLIGGVDVRLKEIIVQVAAELQVDILELEVMADHVHIVCEVSPQFGIHKFVRHAKGRSSRLLRQEFPRLRSQLPSLWTNSYFVSTVGGAPLAMIKQYIENQKHV